ncbi:MAG: hypothetical protein ACTSRG_01105 [Candidatus Helarchaeota archaeon]
MTIEQSSEIQELFDLAHSNPQKATIEIQNFINAIERSKEKDFNTLADAFLALCIANRNMEYWVKGFENARNSINAAKKIKKDFTKNLKISMARRQIGTINNIIQEYNKAIKDFDEALSLLEKNLEQLIKTRDALEQLKITKEDFAKKSSIVKSLYFDILDQKVSVYLKMNDEKKAKASISRPFIKFLEEREKYFLEDLANFALLYSNLAKKLEQPIEFLNWTGELLLLDVFSKKISQNKNYWTNKIHLHIKSASQELLELLNITVDGEILGKEILNVLKEVKLENKDFSFIDKLLKFKNNQIYKKGFDELINLLENAKEANISPVVQLMIMNETMQALSQKYKYREAIQLSKDAIKILKSIKQKNVKNFMTGRLELTLFRVNLKRQDYKQAEKEAKRAIDSFEENINTVAHAFFTKLELASCYMIQNLLDKADSILENVLDVVEHIDSLEYFARLFELLGANKLRQEDHYSAAINFQISAIFYLLLEDDEKYQEFITLAINLYHQYLKTLEFTGVEFN